MAHVWLKIRIWTKVTIFALVAIYIVSFIIGNRHQPVNVWVFYGTTLAQQPLLEVIFITLGIGIIGTLLAGLIRGTIRQIRDVRARGRQEQLAKDVADLKKGSKLQSQGDGPPVTKV